MMHSVIEGPPGVGKTRLGKILAKIYCSLGIIPSDKFQYVKATDMIGQHIGATKHLTQNVIDKANGGVLFIDEAYALSTNGSVEGKDSFGKECIDTLNFNLSENKKKLIVIIAGYSDHLDKYFFSYNPGLQRRFPYRFKIDKYSGSELAEIFKNNVKKFKWKITSKITDKYLVDFFTSNMENFPYFGGDVENYFKECRMSHSIRALGQNPEIRKKLTIKDLENGYEHYKANKKPDDTKRIRDSMFI